MTYSVTPSASGTSIKQDGVEAISIDASRNVTVAENLTVEGDLAEVGRLPAFQCRAWVNFNGTGTPAIRASGNVSSITDNGTGDYTINFTTAMPDANYAVVFGADSGNGRNLCVVSQTTTSVRINFIVGGTGATTSDATIACVAIFR